MFSNFFLYFNPFDDNWKLLYYKKQTLNICYLSPASGPTSKGCDVTHNFYNLSPPFK